MLGGRDLRGVNLKYLNVFIDNQNDYTYNSALRLS